MNWHLVFASVLALLLPAALIGTGVELRRVRLRIVEDLRNTVFAGRHRDLPQLLLAQARYDRASNNSQIGGRQDEAKQYLGGFVYFFVCLLGFIILFDPISYLISTTTAVPLVSDAIFWTPTAHDPTTVIIPLRRSAGVAGFAFIGGYIFNMRYLIRQTLNQELSALAFVRGALRLLQGMLLAMVAYHVGATVIPDAVALPTMADGTYAAGLAVAFVLGYFPDVGFGRIAKWARIHIKDVDEKALERARVIPLEVIDGIDHEISFRLQESNLYDVQNLAVANPIELYAETPYTLVQTFDWVLQAQLCLVVGVDAFFELKKHRVRTIFDLERAILSKGVPLDYLRGLASVILSDSSPCFRTAVGLSAEYADCNAPGGADSAVMIRHLVAITCDDLHVHRLRALWIAVMNNTAGMDSSNKPLWLFDVGWLPGDPIEAEFQPI